MNLFEYFGNLLSGNFNEDYTEQVREDMKLQAEKRLKEDKESKKS